MNKNDQEFLVQKIRSQYTERESNELDVLRKMDARVKRPARIFAYIFGIIGTMVLGTGMSLAMDVIEPGVYYGIAIGENMMFLGIISGLIGILMVSLTYPIYKKILNTRKVKYADRILTLSESIMNQ